MGAQHQQQPRSSRIAVILIRSTRTSSDSSNQRLWICAAHLRDLALSQVPDVKWVHAGSAAQGAHTGAWGAACPCANSWSWSIASPSQQHPCFPGKRADSASHPPVSSTGGSQIPRVSRHLAGVLQEKAFLGIPLPGSRACCKSAPSLQPLVYVPFPSSCRKTSNSDKPLPQRTGS